MWKAILRRLNASDSIVSLGLGLAVILVLGMLVKNYLTSTSTQQAKSQQEEVQSDEKQALPLNHTVAAGDTLWSIAVKYYNNGYNWTEIQKANKLTNPGLIEKGQSLVIPAVSPQPTPLVQASKVPDILAASTDTSASVGKTYTVVRGDTLWAIAVKEYKNGYRWVDIARANKLVNPDLIHAGNVLQLP